MWVLLVGALAAPTAHQADWLYSSDLSAEFEAWCANGSALAGIATEKYRELHALAAVGLANTSQALEMVGSELYALEVAGRPQSIDPTASVMAAIEAMELAFTPEAAELKNQQLQLRTLQSAYQADYSDGEVLARNGDLLLGQLTKAGRQEKNLEAEVGFALKTPALLAKRAINAKVRRAALDAPVALPERGHKVRAASNASKGIVTVGFPDMAGDSLSTKWDSKCLDYNYNDGNVYMHDCHGDSNQKWFMMDRNGNTDQGEGELHTGYDGNCLDYNYNNGNVYMHGCHGGDNQQWYFDTSGQLKNRWDNKCLDYNYDNGNVYMHDCHAGTNQEWMFSAMKRVDTTSPLRVLEGLKDKLGQRKAECAAHVAQQEALAKQQAGAEHELVAQTADALQRMQDTAAVLQEYGAYRTALIAHRSAGMGLFDRERILYATEVEHISNEAADPVAGAASTAMKAVDVAHGFWVEWKDGSNQAIDNLIKYLDTRHGQLESQLATQEYLRPDKSPHLLYLKNAPPVGLHCPSEAEYADRGRKIDEAIAAMTSAGR